MKRKLTKQELKMFSWILGIGNLGLASAVCSDTYGTISWKASCAGYSHSVDTSKPGWMEEVVNTGDHQLRSIAESDEMYDGFLEEINGWRLALHDFTLERLAKTWPHYAAIAQAAARTQG